MCACAPSAPPTFGFEPKPHEEIGAPLGLSLADGARVSGARFVVLKGMMAALERAPRRLCWMCTPKNLATPRCRHPVGDVRFPLSLGPVAQVCSGQL